MPSFTPISSATCFTERFVDQQAAEHPHGKGHRIAFWTWSSEVKLPSSCLQNHMTANQPEPESVEQSHAHPIRTYTSGREWISTTSPRTGCLAPTPSPPGPGTDALAELFVRDRAAMQPLTPAAPEFVFRSSVRLTRDYYLRVFSADYSLDPGRDRAEG